MNDMLKLEGVYRVAGIVPRLHLGNPLENAREIIAGCHLAEEQGAAVAVFPELALTGYTCEDLFFQQVLSHDVQIALGKLLAASQELNLCIVVGMPWQEGGRLYDGAAVIHRGAVMGRAVKRFLAPGQDRHFTSGNLMSETIASPLFRSGDLCFGIEFGSELYGIGGTSDRLCQMGANAIINLSAIPAGIHEYSKRENTLQIRSKCQKGLYMLVNSGLYESSANSVFDGSVSIYNEGECLQCRQGMNGSVQCVTADFIPRWSDALKRRCSWYVGAGAAIMLSPPLPQVGNMSRLKIKAHPFTLDKMNAMAEAEEILNLLARGLQRRVVQTKAQCLVIGLSGGLDSTFALLVCDQCRRFLGKEASFVLTVTMPGMGTGSRTKNNAVAMAEKLGCRLKTICIKEAVLQHFKDIEHDVNNTNVVYENAQARERTQILMDLANEYGGILVGTGDLSEIALGWCTYNGDHISMYNVNGDVPKTLMRELVLNLAKEHFAAIHTELVDVVNTPVSPELVPGAQFTEKIIGEYELHDFFLYHFQKYGETPEHILALALAVFSDVHGEQSIRQSLALFIRRFFSQQFKRNATTDGPRIGSISLSPHHQWMMPSDMDDTSWKSWQ